MRDGRLGARDPNADGGARAPRRTSMPSRPLRRAVLAAVCLFLCSSAALPTDASAAPLTKRGLSGQVYVWQSGSC